MRTPNQHRAENGLQRSVVMVGKRRLPRAVACQSVGIHGIDTLSMPRSHFSEGSKSTSAASHPTPYATNGSANTIACTPGSGNAWRDANQDHAMADVTELNTRPHRAPPRIDETKVSQ